MSNPNTNPNPNPTHPIKPEILTVCSAADSGRGNAAGLLILQFSITHSSALYQLSHVNIQQPHCLNRFVPPLCTSLLSASVRTPVYCVGLINWCKITVSKQPELSAYK